MKKILILITIALLSSSCLTVKRIQRNCDKFAAVCVTQSEKETEVIYRDSIVFLDRPVPVKLPPDTVEIIDTIPCNELINIPLKRVEKGLVGATAEVSDNILNVSAYLTDSLYIAELKDSIRILNAVKQTTVKEKEYIPVREDTRFGKFAKKWFWGSVVILLLVAGYVGIRIYLKR